ncbi:hypothetical protein HNR77_000285 [Paenibacillus sp. JGP012]|nr:hypothetical protein [Paenibacillus sp. JGP012]
MSFVFWPRMMVILLIVVLFRPGNQTSCDLSQARV